MDESISVIEQVVRYRTPDGKKHKTPGLAYRHEGQTRLRRTLAALGMKIDARSLNRLTSILSDQACAILPILLDIENANETIEREALERVREAGGRVQRVAGAREPDIQQVPRGGSGLTGNKCAREIAAALSPIGQAGSSPIYSGTDLARPGVAANGGDVEDTGKILHATPGADGGVDLTVEDASGERRRET